jgi:hypothetical protein
MTKRLLLIIGILIIAAIAVFIIFSSSQNVNENGNGGFSIRDYLPFGSSGETNVEFPQINSGNDDQFGNQSNIDAPIEQLRKLSGEPVAGAVIFNVGTTSVVRFVEKGTGNVYEAKSDSNKIERLTNTTIPQIIRAFWLHDGSGFLAQTILAESEIVETSFVKLNKSEDDFVLESYTPYTVTISKLPTGIKELSIRPDSAKVFYYTRSNTSNWYISNPDGTNASLVYTSPITEWVPEWVSPNFITMTTKASYANIGYVYTFNISTKTLRTNGEGLVGLSTNSNKDGSLILASSGGAVPQLFMFNKGQTLAIRENTLSEKCVWTKEESATVYCASPKQIPSGSYPDSWYKGVVSTDDQLKKIDLTNDLFYKVFDISNESGQKTDIKDMDISPDENYLIFKNKIDGALWMFRIEE